MKRHEPCPDDCQVCWSWQALLRLQNLFTWFACGPPQSPRSPSK